jgi:DNA-binding YbaB/EbfC family protein
MFGNMMDKLQEMQRIVEESKRKLDSISVEGKAEGVVVEMTGNRKVKNVRIASLDDLDKEDLEDLLTVAFNRALEQADKIHESEMANGARGIIPGM